MIRSVNIIVSGRVQGVYFRANAQKQAQKLDVQGWVRNLADGAVEIQAQGKHDAVAQLISWCHKGPAFARVEQVKVIELTEYQNFTSFEVLRDK